MQISDRDVRDLSTGQLLRGLREAATAWSEYAALLEVEQAAMVMTWLDILLDEYNRRRNREVSRVAR